jgi:hypothetical protein
VFSRAKLKARTSVGGAPGGIRTHGLPLRNGCSIRLSYGRIKGETFRPGRRCNAFLAVSLLKSLLSELGIGLVARSFRVFKHDLEKSGEKPLFDSYLVSHMIL